MQTSSRYHLKALLRGKADPIRPSARTHFSLGSAPIPDLVPAAVATRRGLQGSILKQHVTADRTKTSGLKDDRKRQADVVPGTHAPPTAIMVVGVSCTSNGRPVDLLAPMDCCASWLTGGCKLAWPSDI